MDGRSSPDASVPHRIGCDANTGNGMSMADDHRFESYRSNDPQRRAAEPSRSAEQPRASDPLAELARLIGQRDPFAEFGRNNSRQNSRDAARQAQAAPAAPTPQ